MIGYEVVGVNCGGMPEKITGEEMIRCKLSRIWH